MYIQEIQNIKDKIETAKSDQAKAEGSIEQIEKQWKDDFDCANIDEVKAKIDETETSIASLTTKQEGYMKEIEAGMEAE